MRHLALRFEKENPGHKIHVLPSIGSSGAISALADRKVEIACISRPLKPEEADLGLKVRPLARTPFVFAVQKSNPAAGFSLDEIVRHYDGRVTTWSTGHPVRIVLRPKSDNAHAQLAGISKSLEAALVKVHSTPGIFIAMTDQDAVVQLEKTPGSLGAISLGMLLCEPREVKAVSLDGVPPTLENLRQGRYPYFTEISLVTVAEKAPGEVIRFLEFLHSRQGREILLRFGFLPADPSRTGKR
jgi:phosphate transport system substrate-binding protein